MKEILFLATKIFVTVLIISFILMLVCNAIPFIYNKNKFKFLLRFAERLKYLVFLIGVCAIVSYIMFGLALMWS
jgi:hypothetical protein